MPRLICHPPSVAPDTPCPIARWWHVLAERWSAHRSRLRQSREFEWIADMNADTLRDIGAPDRVIAESMARRELQRSRLWELRQWRDG